MKILYLTYGLPYPPHSGARARDFYLLVQLATRYEVTCVCFLESQDSDADVAALKNLGIRAVGFRAQAENGLTKGAAVARHLLAGRPPATLGLRNQAMFDYVRQVTVTEAFDVVQIEHSLNVLYLDALAKNFRGKKILDLHNIGARQYARMWQLHGTLSERAGFWVKHQLFQKWEANYAAQFDAVVTVSNEDAAWVREQNPASRVSVVENGVDTDAKQVLPEPSQTTQLLFVGTLGYPPNADAAVWFCHAILPLIQAEMPDVTVNIVGKGPRPNVLALAERPGVRVSADVPDLEPFYREAAAVVVPLRAGGGTRLKILEAMAYGRAVVSTRLGAEGLAVADGETIVLADTPSEFAARTLELLRNEQKRRQLAAAARALVAARYGWWQIGQKLFAVYDALGTNNAL